MGCLRRIELKSALARLERDLGSDKRPSAKLLRRLAWGWGNQWWSASPHLVTAMLDWLPKTTGPILECGSGLTTLVLAVAAARSGRAVISLENDPQWADRVLAALPPHLRGCVTLRVSPIRAFGEFDWYSVTPDDLPADIGLVLCDGPPGATRGGRYGLAPVLARRLAPGCVVILDDTQRPGEHAVLKRWRSEFEASLIEEGGTYSVVEIGRSGEFPRIPTPRGPFSIIALAPNEWDGMWMNRQQLLSRLGSAHAILYSTGARSTWDRDAFPRRPSGWLGKFHERGSVIVDQPPAFPIRVPGLKWLDRLAVHAIARRWRRKLRERGAKELIAYLFHPQYDVFVDAIKPDFLVYHAYDLLSLDESNRTLADRQARLLERADLVIASSKVIASELRSRCDCAVHVVPNGVDFPAFAHPAKGGEPADIAVLPRPRIAHIGRLNRKVDIELILSLASAHPHWSFVMVGPIVDLTPAEAALYEKSKRIPNIHLLGTKTRAELPRYVHAIDVGLLAYRVGVLWTQGIYPLKLHEYLASGLPIVSADLPAVRDFPSVVRIANTIDEWSRGIEDALADVGEERRRLRVDIARVNSWTQRARTIGELLDETASSRMDVIPIEPAPE